MIVKKYAYKATIVGLGSFLSIGLSVSNSLANALPGTTVSAKENSRGTLRQGLPGRRLGGGTRGDRVFTDAYAYLAALVTSDNLSQTTAAQPTLLFSVPGMVSAEDAEFILRDTEGEEVYRTHFSINSEAGMVSLDLSEADVAPLEIGKDYRWYFSIIQDETLRANDIAVHGNIRRVESRYQLASQAEMSAIPLEAQLAKIRPLYEEGDLWHDAAVALHALRQVHPDSSAVADEWGRLVTFAGLSAVLQPEAPAVKVVLKPQ